MALQKVVLFSDPHIPFHSRRGLDLFYKAVQWWKPDHLACLGDFIDAWSISSHSKDPARRLRLEEEIEEANGVLDTLDALAGKGRRIYTEGNHCYRLERFVQDKAPELFGLVSIPQLLQLKSRGWQHIRYRQHTKLAKLYLTHDLGFAGRYAPQRTLDAIQHSVAFGHSHRMSMVVEGNVVGEQRIALNTGWMGDVDAVDYLPRAKVMNWSLGFGVGYIDPRTNFVKLDMVPMLSLGKKRLTCTLEGQVFNA